MQVHPEQLIPGCIVSNQITGKSSNPIIEKHTVIDEKHIFVLKHFGFELVAVENKLNNGKIFKPEPFQKKKSKGLRYKKAPLSFDELYLEAVSNYKKHFQKWQGGTPVDYYEIYNMMTPLFEHISNQTLDLFLLHKYATKQDYFYHHAVAVALISVYIAKRMKYPKKEYFQIGIAAILADCGMAQIQENLYQTDRKISKAEYEEIKNHPTYSLRMVEGISAITKAMKLAILQHHERMDGTGYPIGVHDEKIHPFAKIIAISDAYHAMSSERKYQTKQSPFKVLEEMLTFKHQQFDYPLLKTFVDSLMKYSIGTNIRLSTGEEATILFVNDQHPTRPLVRSEQTLEIIELFNQPTIFIEDIIES